MTEVLFSYNVDNKIVNKDEVIIIDYKTDSKEEDPSVQLGFYKKAIEQSIYKDKNVPHIFQH